MGVEYYIVDDAGQNVLDIHKSYWLLADYSAEEYDPDEESTVTSEVVERRAVNCRESWAWLPPLILHWLEHVAQGRPCRLANDNYEDEDLFLLWTDGHFEAQPGWTLYGAFQCGDGWPFPLWRSPALDPDQPPAPPGVLD